jgi:predicted phage terminase large subunit-like protein
MQQLSEREQLICRVIARAKLPLAEEKAALEGSLLKFVEKAWPSLDPAPYQKSWAVDALADHLQAVTEGHIKRLLVNFPPRAAKTNVTSILYPSWIWARSEKSYLSGPQVRFLCGSYNDELALTNATKHRRLLLNPWYQRRWGKRFTITLDQNTKSHFQTSAGGARISISARGSLLGIGADIILCDDPHNTHQSESEAERRSALTWWREISTTRLNDPQRSAIVVVMQRLHEEDISGVILSSETSDFVHLMIPAEYEARRHCVTVLGWNDPRGCDDDGTPLLVRDDGGLVPRDAQAVQILEEREGALFWPERFGHRELDRIKAELGPYMSSGRLQQAPTPKGGGIIKRDWIELWDPPDKMFPVMSYVIAAVDPAFTEKQSNDPSAMVVFGVFTHPELRKTRVILIDAWRKHLQLHGPPTPRLDHEMVRIGDTRQAVRQKAAMWERRVGHEWGLVEWVANTCRKFGVGKLLIENKASGISAAQELQRLHGREGWETWLQDPKGADKFSRLLSVQSIFSQGLVYAPERAWSAMWMDEVVQYPAAKYDDLVDATSMGLSYLRNVGLLRFDDEVQAEIAEGERHRPLRRRSSLYPC